MFLQNQLYQIIETGHFGNIPIERLAGYNGEEKFIDVNVFYGDEEVLAEYGN